ncbi:MAG: cytochrome C oxidase subunit IV family protein [bacterium]|nr:cytochrome C oxidase subunit IV family protein [bacterium]
MSDAHDSHGDFGDLQMGTHHVSSALQFTSVLIALLFLTIITVAVAQFDFGGANMLIAMGIASVKAALVILFFMHVKYDTAINKIMFLSSFLFLSLLFIFTLADRATRQMDHRAHTIKTPVASEWVHPNTLNSDH